MRPRSADFFAIKAALTPVSYPFLYSKLLTSNLKLNHPLPCPKAGS